MASSLGMQIYKYFQGSGQGELAQRQASSLKGEFFIRSAKPGSLSHLPYGVARAVQTLQQTEGEHGSQSPEYLARLFDLGECLEAHKMMTEAHDVYLNCKKLIKLFEYSADHQSSIACQKGLDRTASN